MGAAVVCHPSNDKAVELPEYNVSRILGVLCAIILRPNHKLFERASIDQAERH